MMGDDCREPFFMARLLSVAALLSSIAIGQQQGVSLVLLGQTTPNNSLVNFDDLLFCTNGLNPPTNANGEQTLMCVTDLVACCETQGLGNWYLPGGGVIVSGGGNTFQTNRGQNEMLNNQQFYGSVRLWRRYTPPQRGLFRCELPDASGVNQNLYVNILFFTRIADRSPLSVAISPSGSTTAGETYSLVCSATLHDRNPAGSPNSYIMPPPTFEWSFGPNGNAPLPSGMTATTTVFNSNNRAYTSTLQFSPLSQSHEGNYTCRLGVVSLVNSHNFTVVVPSISAAITANLNTPLMVGQTGNTLTCDVTVPRNLNPTIAYQWTRNDGTTVGTNSNMFTLSSVSLSDAGIYICRATVSSDLLSNSIVRSVSLGVMIQIPNPESVTVSNSGGDVVRECSANIVTCTVELGPAVMESELSLLMVSAQLSRDGTMLNLTGPTMTDTTFTFEAAVNSFNKSNVGNYTCTATIRPRPSSTFLTGIGQMESLPFEIIIGVPSTQLPRCYSANDIAITVVVTSLIECLLAAPIIAAVLALCWKRNQRRSQYKSDTTTAVQGGEVNPGEDVYEEPDIKTTATTAPGKFKLTECPAYVATANTLQPCVVSEAQLQSGYYEL